MATTFWRGNVNAVAQVSTVQVTGYDAATTYKLTINGKVLSVVGTTDAAGTAAALSAAWNALPSATHMEFAEVTASVVTDTVTLTADTKGLPFTVTSSVSGGAGTIGAVTAVTAATGPNHWDNAANWSGGAVPVGGDSVVLQNSSVDILYGLAQSAVTLGGMYVYHSFSGTIGLPDTNANGYNEYRSKELAISVTELQIGVDLDDVNPGSGRIRINLGTAQNRTLIFGVGESLESDVPAIQWRGTHPSNYVRIDKGTLGVGLGRENATIENLYIGYQGSLESDVSVICSQTVTVTNVIKLGGTLTLHAASTLLRNYAGLTKIFNDVIHTEVHLEGGTLEWFTGTITTLYMGNNAFLNCSKDTYPKTLTNPIEIHGNQVRIKDPARTINSLVLDFNHTQLLVNSLIELGPNVRLTRAAL